jgi:cyclopropane fatty-acyl-phospholipid synthase-like methyltransferase
LAEHGFDVTGVDFASSAVEKGQEMAQEASLEVRFVVDDLTNLKQDYGTFDLLVDYGTMDDLKPKARDLYVKNVLPLSRPGSQYLMFCFEWQPRWWERPFFDRMALEPGEVERRFGEHFHIERIAGGEKPDFTRFPPATSTYLMTRNGQHG